MDVYERLARVLDKLPQGFPATESGVELKILRKIFEPDEAEMALQVSPLPETAEAVSKRLDRPFLETRAILDGMAHKGQIGCFKMDGRQVYRLIPFVVGIYEFQRRERLTKELAELFEEYAPVLSKKVGGYRPHLTRVIPINIKTKTELRVLQHEDIRQIIANARSFRVQDCICRREQGLLGNPCKHTLKNCVQYSMEEDAFDYFKLDGDTISKEEALKIIDEAEKEGLVHTTYNVKEVIGGFLCNCCSCCCGLMRGLKEFHSPYILAKSSYLATIDRESCLTCGLCKDERCPMDAIIEEDSGCRVLPERCIGCGVCVITCPSESISLVERSDSERDEIAEDMIDWSKRRLADRESHL